MAIGLNPTSARKIVKKVNGKRILVKNGVKINSWRARAYFLLLVVLVVFALSVLLLHTTIEQGKHDDPLGFMILEVVGKEGNDFILKRPGNLWYRVESPSVGTTLKIGDKVVLKSIFTIYVSRDVRRANPDEILAAPYPDGDIVFAYVRASKLYILSRVVEKYQAENGTWYLITQADASESYDPWSPFPVHDVEGKVVAVNPVLPTYLPWFTLLLFVSTISGVCCCLIMVYISYKERKTGVHARKLVR